MKFLLVDTTNDFRQPSLGLAYIAGAVQKNFGDKVQLKIIGKDLYSNIQSFRPDIVGITAMSKNYNWAKEYAKIATAFDLPVIMGGVHITALPESMSDDIDVAVIGEGEETIIELINAFGGNWMKHELMNIKGIAFRDFDNIVLTPQRKLIEPLDSVPYPARDLLAMGNITHMISSRGCPYRCLFCSTSRNNRNQVRYASAEYVVGEIEMLRRNHRVTYITVYDDLFALNTKRTIEIQQLMAAKNLIGKFGMSVNMRANLVTDELAEILRDMNVDVVGIGVESGCQKTLDYLKGGGITVEDNHRAIQILHNHSILTFGTFIIGSPGESKKDAMETVKFIEDNRMYHFSVGVLMPFPGTPVWDYALSRGYVSDDMDWSRLDYEISPNSVFIADKISWQEVTEICARLDNRKKGCLPLLARLHTLRHPHRFLSGFIKARLKG